VRTCLRVSPDLSTEGTLPGKPVCASHVKRQAPQMRHHIHPLLLFALLCLGGCASFPPQAFVRGRGYEGPPLPESAVATVFISDGRPRYESGFICAVNDRPVTKFGSCASVVYLSGGTHTLKIRYRSPLEIGEGRLTIQVEPGKLYQLNATSFRTQGHGVVTLIPMREGSVLTHRNVAPNLVSKEKADDPIPYLAE